MITRPVRKGTRSDGASIWTVAAAAFLLGALGLLWLHLTWSAGRPTTLGVQLGITHVGSIHSSRSGALQSATRLAITAASDDVRDVLRTSSLGGGTRPGSAGHTPLYLHPSDDKSTDGYLTRHPPGKGLVAGPLRTQPVSPSERSLTPISLGGGVATEGTHAAEGLEGSRHGATSKHHLPVHDYNAPDDSVRCSVSDICERQAECRPGKDGLGCVVTAQERQARVKDAIAWAWKGYTDCAWGKDELMPLSCTGSTWFDLAGTLVDSLDTILLAGMNQEAEKAIMWIDDNFDASTSGSMSLFETTIRVLGGLLSAFSLASGDARLLHPALDLGLRLMAGFDSPSGVPYGAVNLRALWAGPLSWSPHSILADATTMSLEFSYLAKIAGRPDIAEPALNVLHVLNSTHGIQNGLLPTLIEPRNAAFMSRTATLGAYGDSCYEYMLKQWLLRGKRDTPFLDMYKAAMRGVRDHMVAWTAPPEAGGWMYIGSASLPAGTQPWHSMEHLACFVPGMFALGHLHGVSTGEADELTDLQIAQELMHTCYQMYQRVPTGISSDRVEFNKLSASDTADTASVGGGHFTVGNGDANSLLRPETVESLFILWRVTGEERYRDWGWNIFRAFEMHARHSEHGYMSLNDVRAVPASPQDKMESFFVAETLKYLLLLFEDDPAVLPLDQFVFNTEAHPLPMFDSNLEEAQRAAYIDDEAARNRFAGKFHKEDLQEQIVYYRQLLRPTNA